MVIVLFHDPHDDMSGKLNECLQKKNVSVGPSNEVACVKFPDGWLIICYDQAPSQHVKQVIADTIKEVRPDRQVLLVHDGTKGIIRREQQALTSRSGVLKDAGSPLPYSHIVGNKLYDGLIGILSHSHLRDLLPAIDQAGQKTLMEEFSGLKHDLGRTLSAIDIDLQGLVAANFNAGYKREIVETYQATPPQPVALKDGGATLVGPRVQIMTAAPNISGKATSALERVREIVHNDSFSIRTVIGKSIELSGAKLDQLPQVQQAWESIETLLPKVKYEPVEIYEILQLLETGAGLDQLAAQEIPDRIFHTWFYLLDEALNHLRDAIMAQVPNLLTKQTAPTK
jgi:hypothetical protein